MGILSDISQAVAKALGVRTSKKTDGLIDLFTNWSASGPQTGYPWTANRAEQAGHFRGWNYVATRAICEEIAVMAPQVCEIHSGEDVRAERQKTLRGLDWRERREAERNFQSKFLSKRQRTKSLAHLQDSDELEPVSSNDPLVRLLKNPNGPDTAWSFFYKIPLYLELTGNSYIWIVEDKSGMPCQLWNIPSQWVIDQPGDDELIGSYLIRPTMGIVPTDNMGFGAGWFPGMGGSERVDAKNVIKIAYPSSLSLIDGYSPLSATAQWNDVSEYIDSARCHAFYNGAYPGVVLLLDKEMKGAVDREELKRIAIEFDNKYASVKRTGRTSILAPGMTMQAFRQTSVEMDYVNSADQMSNFQLAARRVPKSIVGLNEQESYASMIATKAGFYSGTIRPKLALIGQVFTEKLAKRFGEHRVIHWDDPTPEDPQFHLEKWKWLESTGKVTPNEVRLEFGLPEWEHGGDDPEMPMGKQVVPYATGHDPMDDLANQMAQQGQQQGGMPDGDPLDDVMSQLLGDDAGGDGADSQTASEPASPGIPSPLAKRLNGHALNGKGVANGTAH